jgi:hypothetical protein
MQLRVQYICLCLFVLLTGIRLRADVTGSIQGYVRDSSGAVLTAAHVVVTNASTNFKRETTTDAQGG